MLKTEGKSVLPRGIPPWHNSTFNSTFNNYFSLFNNYISMWLCFQQSLIPLILLIPNIPSTWTMSILSCPTDAQRIAHPWAYLIYCLIHCPMGILSISVASTLSGARCPFTVAYHNLDAVWIQFFLNSQSHRRPLDTIRIVTGRSRSIENINCKI